MIDCTALTQFIVLMDRFEDNLKNNCAEDHQCTYKLRLNNLKLRWLCVTIRGLEY